ncbi:MAG: tyrosine-type recombinase/integrase [Pseudomonadota bacterium]|nr:tyrosine-type recombinase/integrase [Pseudomonadota bacterium]
MSGKLTDRKVKSKLAPGMHADGGGLYLIVNDKGNKSFVFQKMLDGKRKTLGMGSYPYDLDLDEARLLAMQARKTLKEERSFDAVRRLFGSEKVERNTEPETYQGREYTSQDMSVSFGEFANQWMDDNKPQRTRNDAGYSWRRSINQDAKLLAPMDIDRIDIDDVLAVLRPIWTKKPAAAKQCQQRIARILAAARVMKLRDGDNPAVWANNLEMILAPAPLRKKHHEAVPWQEVPSMYAWLREQDGMPALAFRFLLLTGLRSNEARSLEVSDIDYENNLIIIPAERMKMGREHRVPLSAEALAVIEEAAELKEQMGIPGSQRVFASHRSNTGYVAGTSLHLLRSKSAHNQATVHGYRTTLRTWLGDVAKAPFEVAEEILAHLVGNAVSQAYNRTDILERRRPFMTQWADYLVGDDSDGKVVPIRSAG